MMTFAKNEINQSGLERRERPTNISREKENWGKTIIGRKVWKRRQEETKEKLSRAKSQENKSGRKRGKEVGRKARKRNQEEERAKKEVG